MRPQPETPSKADTGIENIKKSLSVKWGIQFPARDSNWSPSKRDPKRAEDRISTLIQWLFFKKRKPPHEQALDIALHQFETHALQIESKWHFKPLGEHDVLPSSETSNSALRQKFLKKRSTLSEDAIEELTKTLEGCLKTKAEQVTALEKTLNSGRMSLPCYQLRLAKTFTDEPIPALDLERSAKGITNKIDIGEVSPIEPSLPKPRSSLAPSRLYESEPGPGDRSSTAQHPSSSEYYPDYEMAELLVNADAMDTSSAVLVQAAHARKAGEPAKLDQSVSSEDEFETPPTTPPLRKHSSLSPSMERKRAHPDSMQAPPSRNVSRKTSSEKSAHEVSDLAVSVD